MSVQSLGQGAWVGIADMCFLTINCGTANGLRAMHDMAIDMHGTAWKIQKSPHTMYHNNIMYTVGIFFSR